MHRARWESRWTGGRSRESPLRTDSTALSASVALTCVRVQTRRVRCRGVNAHPAVSVDTSLCDNGRTGHHTALHTALTAPALSYRVMCHL